MALVDIITCPQWGARSPTTPIRSAPRATEIIFHHTAGHHAEISDPANESRDESIRYAQAIQNFHMDVNGWGDSGHNFLVCRNGLVLQGRWKTVSAIQQGYMVVSAHCPYHNGQVGIEHEHVGSEEMTAAQKESSARLQAWVAWKYGLTRVLPSRPHSQFYATACPANLKDDIAPIRARAQTLLNEWLSS